MMKTSCKYLARLEACSVDADKKIFAFNDSGTNNRATIDVKSRRCRKVQIDGALHEIQPYKCDWCLWDYSNGEFLFIELKGRDFEHAVKQLENTIKWFLANITPITIYKETFIIVRAHSGIPANDTQTQLRKSRFAKAYRSVLKCTHSGTPLSFF